MKDFWGKPVDTEDAKRRMAKAEPYHCRPWENPTSLTSGAAALLKRYEALTEQDAEEKERTLTELFGTYNSNVFLGQGFRCDYGFNIHFHGLAVLNYNVVILDTSPVNIGDGVLIGPGTCLVCAGHGIHPDQRDNVLTSAPVTLEDKVWLGANVTVLGGVTVGKGSIIGAGSVVTKDIPAGVIAGGVPCRVIREITDDDIYTDMTEPE